MNCSRVELVWQFRSLISWAQANRASAELFHSVDEVPIPLSFDDHPPFMRRTSAIFLSASSTLSPVFMNETSSRPLPIVAKRHADSDRPYLPAGYHLSRLLLPRLVALEVSGADIMLNVTLESGPTVESLSTEVLLFQCQFSHRDADVRELEGQL